MLFLQKIYKLYFIAKIDSKRADYISFLKKLSNAPA